MLFTKNEPLSIIANTSNSKGQFLGRFARGRWLYFGKIMTRYHISLRLAKQWLGRFEVLGAIIFGFGFFALSFWRVYKTNSLDLIFTKSFWLASGIATNSAPLLFWLGVVCFGFLVYRLISLENKISFVEEKKYGAEINRVAPDFSVTDWEQVKKIPRSKRTDISETFTNEVNNVLEASYRVADKFGSQSLLPDHILYALLSSDKVKTIFLRLNVPVTKLQAHIAKAFTKQSAGKTPAISSDVQQILFHAYELAFVARQSYVNVTELLLATVRQSESIQELLYDLNVDAQKLANVIEWVRIRELLRNRYKSFSKAASRVSKSGIDRAMTAVATPFLNSFSQDLTLAAKYGHLAPCVARDKEIDEVFRIIEGGRQGVVLIGGHGVGKRSVIEGVVQKMIEGNAPKRLLDKRMVQLSTSSLLAGTTVSGAQERLIRIMNEVRRAKNIILFIENLQDLIKGGGESGLDVSETLAEHLGGANVLMLATATLDGYNKQITNSQIGSTITKVEIKEMDENQAIQVLESKAGGVEYKHNVFFSYDSVAQSVRLAQKFLHDQVLPESALEIMTEVASYARNNHGDNTLVSAEDVASVISSKTGIPATSISEDESDKLLRLEDEMHKQVIGQDEAVKLVANALRRARAEVRSTKRPIANFLFLGPTGVGKTELAKTIARVYFGGENRMIRIDMSEFQDKSGVYRLIGQPGQQGTGLLTEAVRQQPFSLVLLDEMEKADPDVLNIFLQVFDDGRLTDSVGRVIDFTNTIIIATSNAGTQYVQDQVVAGVELEQVRQSLIKGELKKYYKPEFINRFDGIVLFKPLERLEIMKIARLMLNRVAKDLEKRGVELRVEDVALEALAVDGYDPEFGARPMRRAIQDKVENQLAELILANKLVRRDVVVLGEGAKIRIEGT